MDSVLPFFSYSAALFLMTFVDSLRTHTHSSFTVSTVADAWPGLCCHVVTLEDVDVGRCVTLVTVRAVYFTTGRTNEAFRHAKWFLATP